MAWVRSGNQARTINLLQIGINVWKGQYDFFTVVLKTRISIPKNKIEKEYGESLIYFPNEFAKIFHNWNFVTQATRDCGDERGRVRVRTC